jgi:hypothetical protein
MNKLTSKEWLLVLLGLLLIVGVRLLPVLTSPVEGEVSQLARQWSGAGLSTDWERARRDLSLQLSFDGFSCDGLEAERLSIANETLRLRGLFSTPRSLTRPAVLAESTPARGVSLDGVIALNHGLELEVDLVGEATPHGLALRGSGSLRRGGAELSTDIALVISPERVLLNLTSEESQLLAVLHPRLEVIASTIQAEDLARLYPELPFKATGSVKLRGFPDENRFVIESEKLELRRRNAPESWSFAQLHLAVNDDGWRLRTATLQAEGSGEKLESLLLDTTIDLNQLAGSLLPLGYQGAGSLTVWLSLSDGEIQQFALSGDSLRLSGEELALDFSGDLSYRDGTFSGKFELDTCCGALLISFTDGVARIEGDGLELTALHESLTALIKTADDGGYLRRLLEDQDATVAFTNCLLGEYRLGDLTGRLSYDDGTLSAELKLTAPGGGASIDWNLAKGRLRLSARWWKLPLVLLNTLSIADGVIAPTAGECDGSLRLTLEDGEPTALNLSLEAEGLATPLPTQITTLWDWADLSTEAPLLTDAALDFTWKLGGRASGQTTLRLTSPSLRVTLDSSSWVAWGGELSLSGVLEVPSHIARRAAERGVLIFRRADGWGAIPFALGGSISDPQPRLDTEQARRLAAEEPPPD